MSKIFYDITFAFTGIRQACNVVHQIAHKVKIDDNEIEVMINNALNVNPNSTLDVYRNSEANFHIGLNILIAIIIYASNTRYLNLTRYLLSLIGLERRLRKNYR